MATTPEDERSRALLAGVDAVTRVERALIGTADPRPFTVEDRVARRETDPGGLDLERLADPFPRWAFASSRGERITLASHSIAVVLGKFGRESQVKARAYLTSDGHPRTLKVWSDPGGKRPLGARERAVRRELAATPDYRMPALIAEGSVEGVDYLLEPVIYGYHPRTPEARRDAAEDLVPSLARGYVAHGVADVPLDEMVSSRFPDRLARLVRDPEVAWDPSWPAREHVLLRLLRLVERNRRLPCSLGHGDLVTTNIIRNEDRSHTIVDWEFAKRMPVAFDMVKLLLSGGDPHAVQRSVGAALKPFGGRGWRRYRWTHQLALGICQLLSWAPDRRERARHAGRLEQFDTNLRRQLAWLVTMVDD